MPKPAQRRHDALLFLTVCCGASMIGLCLGNNGTPTVKAERPLPQKSDEKTIERTQFNNEPFRFGDLSVKKTNITLGEKFSATSIARSGGGQTEDWLENLKFTVENTSEKPITYIDVELDFPETMSARGMMVVNQLGIGVPPFVSGDRLKQTTPLMLDPAETITFMLSAQRLQMIKDFLAFKNFQLGDLNRVTIRIGYLVFEDGTKWEIGRYYRPNPNAPGGYERIQ
jgi:hypothetical protein